MVCWGDPAHGKLGTPIFTSSAPAATIGGGTFTRTFTADPVVGSTVTVAVASGSLPPGLTLGSDGTLSGSASAEDSFDLTVSASNGLFPAST